MRIAALGAPLLLVASVVIVSVLGWMIAPLRRAMILVPYRVRNKGELWRLLTAGWLHGGVGHLAFNMLTLWFFADPVQRALGAPAFVALYVSAVVVAFVPTTLRHMHEPGYGTIGASGAVAAVMFSAILLEPRLRLFLFFIPIPVPALVFAAGYLAYTAWQAYGAKDGVNHGAHFAGALYGVMFTWAFEPARVERAIRSLF
ncbi:MAG TPA: rhomboid family intramembrane serine protease [Minicystis sp.]|nr:rhomboid family intramembrane serine protease [Minicystis sp.]